VQSLKSTAFAVTLLAISFGLYCVSSDNTPPEAELIDPITFDDSFSTSQSGSMALPSHNLSNQAAPIQISTNVAPKLNNSLPSISAPQLPQLQTPNLSSNFSANTPTAQSASAPVNLPAPTLPSFSQAGSQTQPGFQQPANQFQPAPNQLKLPEIATRQPVSTSPTVRDDGLINALKTNDFNPQKNTIENAVSNDNSFKTNNQPLTATQPVSTDNSFNSQATAVTKDNGDFAIKTADGSIDLGPPSLSLAPTQPTKPAPFSIANVWKEVDQLVAADEYRRALGALSQHYGRKGLTGPQKQKLQGWLDALAGKVIYSTEHLFFKKPHVVQPGETLASIASQLNVPGEVLYNINQAQFNGSNEVSPGMQLKIVKGPFHAEVDLETRMMTLFIKNLYAGRFPVAMGISGSPGEGNYEVKVKSPTGFTWRDADGKEYPAGTPGNGYGPYWMGLSGSLCIHAVESGTPQGHRGCIGLSEKDAKDVYGILSKESQISIVR